MKKNRMIVMYNNLGSIGLAVCSAITTTIKRLRWLRCVVVVFPFIIACGGQLEDLYENVEKLRALAVTFDNNGLAEAAPGDTVTVRAFFSGGIVKSAYWSISTQLLSSSFFEPDTFGDSLPLEQFMIPGTYKEYFGNRTDSVVFNFRVPENIIKESQNLSIPVGMLLPDSIDDSLKSALNAFTVGQMLALLDTVTLHPELLNPAFLSLVLGTEITLTKPEIEKNLNLLLQVFSVKIRVFGVVNNSYKIRTYFTVRKNSRLKRAGINVEVNRLPEIKSVTLYKVKGTISSFEPVTNASEINHAYLLGSQDDTVFIEKGYSYFLYADISENVIDTGYDFISAAPAQETMYYKWFYRNDIEVSGVSKDELMKLPAMTYDSSIVNMLPSLDSRMTNFTLWLCVYDDLFGVRFRPRGFAFKAMHGVFKYSDGY